MPCKTGHVPIYISLYPQSISLEFTGITYKTFVRQTKKSVIVSADNTFYEPYEIPLENVFEVWKYVRGILPENYKPGKTNETYINTVLQELKTSIKELDDKVSSIK